MDFKSTKALVLVAMLTPFSTSFAESNWTGGIISGVEVTEETKAFAVPWLVYRNNGWQVSPVGVDYGYRLKSIALRTGVELDYEKLLESTADGILLNQQLMLPLGPLTMVNQLTVRASHFSKVQSKHNISVDMQVLSGFAVLEAEGRFESSNWSDETQDHQMYGTVSGSFVKPLKSWRVGGTVKQLIPFESEIDPSTSLSIMLMKTW